MHLWHYFKVSLHLVALLQILKLYFTEVLDYAPIMRTLIGKLKFWSQYLNTVVISMISWIIVSKSFGISSSSKWTLISWFLKGSYLGKTSLDLSTRLRRTIEGNLPYCKFKVIYLLRETFRHFYTRAVEHMGISNLTRIRLKNVKQSAISDHLL